jgi:hypothetical protein
MPPADISWRVLEANAHLPEVQEFLRGEIRSHTLRVAVRPDGGVSILPGDNGGFPSLNALPPALLGEDGCPPGDRFGARP